VVHAACTNASGVSLSEADRVLATSSGGTWDATLALSSDGVKDISEAMDGTDQLSGTALSLLTKEKELRELSWDPGSPQDNAELDMVEDLLTD
jgi:hypothetical protein